MTSSFPSNRITRRRSSATPPIPQPPIRPAVPQASRPAVPQARPPVRNVTASPANNGSTSRNPALAATSGSGSTPRAPFLTLSDHGRVYVADLPKLSDGQLTNLAQAASQVFASLEQRIGQLEADLDAPPRDAVIRAATKRDVTARFIKAIEAERNGRRNNPHLRAAADESLPRAFMGVARHRLPGETFNSLLQEALNLVKQQEEERPQRDSHRTERLPVVVSDGISYPSAA